MHLALFFEGFILLTCLIAIRGELEDKEHGTDKTRVMDNSHHVLENGRVVSKPIPQPIPVDQIPFPELELDRSSGSKAAYFSRGDMLFSVEEADRTVPKRPKRKVIAERNLYGESNRWPGGIVPYQLPSNIDYRVQKNVLSAIEHWHQRTCVRFEPYNPERHRNIACKVVVQDSGPGCATYIGYKPGADGLTTSYSIYLPIQCSLGSTIHEFGHVIGFYHEMSRTDRDKEIVVSLASASRSDIAQYEIMPDPVPGYYGQPYDLGSVMHYYATEIMGPRDNRRAFLLGQRVGLSFLDMKLANLAYRCSDRCNPKPVCENEGYVDQNCRCACPDGFFGDRCNQLQGFSARLLPPTATTTTTIPINAVTAKASVVTSSPTSSVRWLEWSNWSNCSESCGAGIRIRTRLCSKPAADGISNPCDSLGGDSFEMSSCQNAACIQGELIMSCTFDLVNETCPIVPKSDQHIKLGAQADQIQSISDHTRGDGKYFILVGNNTSSNYSQALRFSPPFYRNSSNEPVHCLKFWYLMRKPGLGSVNVIRANGKDDRAADDSFTFETKDRDVNWRDAQRTIRSAGDYELSFTFQPYQSQHGYVAIDDISIVNGACQSKKVTNYLRRKRAQQTLECSRTIDLTSSNSFVSITSPDYPNLYPSNALCYYYIRTNPNDRIALQFTDFNIANYDQNNCDDTVEIRYYHLGQPGPKYCGLGANSNSVRFTSSKNYMLVIFQSDRSYAGRGFRAQVALVP